MKRTLTLLLLLSLASCAQTVSDSTALQWHSFGDYSLGLAKLEGVPSKVQYTHLAIQLQGSRNQHGRVEFEAVVFDDQNGDHSYQASEMRARRRAVWSDSSMVVSLPQISLAESISHPWVKFWVKTERGQSSHLLRMPE